MDFIKLRGEVIPIILQLLRPMLFILVKVTVTIQVFLLLQLHQARSRMHHLTAREQRTRISSANFQGTEAKDPAIQRKPSIQLQAMRALNRRAEDSSVNV